MTYTCNRIMRQKPMMCAIFWGGGFVLRFLQYVVSSHALLNVGIVRDLWDLPSLAFFVRASGGESAAPRAGVKLSLRSNMCFSFSSSRGLPPSNSDTSIAGRTLASRAPSPLSPLGSWPDGSKLLIFCHYFFLQQSSRHPSNEQ